MHKAISMAGGWTEKAEQGTIKVTRVVDGVAQPIDIALDDLPPINDVESGVRIPADDPPGETKPVGS